MVCARAKSDSAATLRASHISGQTNNNILQIKSDANEGVLS
jgi:hypothetical protein